MTQIANTLIVLIDADDLKGVFSAWPDDICLAACLDRNGDCSLVVFCRAERAALPDRLVALLGKKVKEVAIVPHVPGFATRPFLYSDERRLMALVGSDASILEEATDYAINLNYALEEGLDPAVLLGLPTSAKAFGNEDGVTRANKQSKSADPAPSVSEPSRATGSGTLSPLLPEFLRRSAEHARRPRFASVRTADIGQMAVQH